MEKAVFDKAGDFPVAARQNAEDERTLPMFSHINDVSVVSKLHIRFSSRVVIFVLVWIPAR